MMSPAAALLIVLSLTATANAGQQEGSAPPADDPNQQTAKQQAVNVDRLPLNLNRISRELKHAADLEERDGLGLRYTIQIYGAAPPLDIFSEESDLVNGPVPYGAPTHRELIDHVTPREFRPPVADFSALLRWLSERNKKK
jgi:hypothetical protein